MIRERLRSGGLAAWAAWAPAALVLLWALVRVVGLERGFPLVALVAWTPFILPLALAALVLAALLRRRGAVAVAAAAALLLALAVAPRGLGDGHDPVGADGPELRIMSANLKLGGVDAEAVVELVREEQVEVLAVQELTLPLVARLRAAGLGELLPRRLLRARGSSLGAGIFAAHPLRPRAEVQPGGYAFVMPRARVETPGGEALEVASVHVSPPTSAAGVRSWEEGLAALPAPGATLTILAGDFNATLDHAALREVIARGYVDAGDATGGGLEPTWPDRVTRPPLTIDHLLVDDRVAVVDYAVHELEGSDHRAVSATLRLPAG